jgi:streptogramin lyase
MVSATTGIINSVAGGVNQYGYAGDGAPATSASLAYPFGIAVDGNGNIYIADNGNNVLRVVYMGGTQLTSLIATETSTTATAGYIYTIAGGQGIPTSGDGDGTLATTATLRAPVAVTVDSQGNVFISDSGDEAVRRVDAVSGIISTISVTGQTPSGLAVDASDNVYYGAANSCVVFQYNPLTAVTTTVAGNGNCGTALGDGGTSTAAALSAANAVAADGAGSLYILEPDGVRFVNANSSNLAFPQAQYGIVNPPQILTVADADILNYPFGSTAPVTMTPLISSVGATGPAMPAPFLTTAVVPLPAGAVADCGTVAMNLTPGQTCAIGFSVQTVTNGNYYGVAIYADNSVSLSGAPLTVNLSANVTGTAPTVSLIPGLLPPFQADTIGTASAPQILTLTNLSTTTPLAIKSIAATPGFAQTNNCGNALAAGAACTITVTFSTTTHGVLQSGSITVWDDATTGGGTQSAQVAGMGMVDPITISPAGPLTFTSVLNQSSAAQTVTLSNLGPVPLTIGNIFPGRNASNNGFSSTDNCFAPLPANTGPVASSCTISITYTPTTIIQQTQALTVSSNGTGNNVVNLTGNATVPTVVLSTSAIAFPNTTPGGAGSAEVTLTNTGNGPLTFCSQSTCTSGNAIQVSQFYFDGRISFRSLRPIAERYSTRASLATSGWASIRRCRDIFPQV